MKFSEIEVQDLFKAWIALSVAFAILIGGDIFSISFLYNFILSAVTVGVGFILHEMGHKFMAQRYGCFAEFRSFDMMLLLAIAMSFLGFIFAAPGAVMISGRVNLARSGRISLAGPLMSLALGVIFVVLLYVQVFDVKIVMSVFETSTDIFLLPWKFLVCYIGAKINMFIALFNLLPVSVLDGKKILAWNKTIYGIMVAVTVLMMVMVF
ncbi:site-2 protease family protein [candidate division KSB1 bacterium]